MEEIQSAWLQRTCRPQRIHSPEQVGAAYFLFSLMTMHAN